MCGSGINAIGENNAEQDNTVCNVFKPERRPREACDIVGNRQREKGDEGADDIIPADLMGRDRQKYNRQAGHQIAGSRADISVAGLANIK